MDVGGTAALLDVTSATDLGSTRLLLGSTAHARGARLGVFLRNVDGGEIIQPVSWQQVPTNASDFDGVILEVRADMSAGTVDFLTNGYSSPEGAEAFSTAQVGPDTAPLGVFIGARSNGASDQFNGRVGALAVFNGEVQDDDRAAIYTHLASLWSISDVGPKTVYDPAGPLPAITFPWCGPSAIELAAGDFCIGGVTRGGSTMVAQYNPISDTWQHTMLFELLQVDDHVAPAFVQLSDGHVVAAYATHGGGQDEIYVQKTTTPGDLSTFGAATDIMSAITPFGANRVESSYAQLSVTTDGTVHLFTRIGDLDTPGGFSGTKEEYWCHSMSADGGVTWGTAHPIIGPMRPYTISRAFGNRVYFAFNDTHPAATSNGALGAENSVYLGYIEGGNVYNHDGTLVGAETAGPYDPKSDFTRVYDGTAPNARSWVYDMQVDGSGNVAIVFVTYPSAPSDYTVQTYNRAHWNGTTWTISAIATDGYLGLASQPTYAGGAGIDPADLDTVYLSRRVGGKMQIYRYVTTDGGTTWTTSLMATDAARDAIRPIVAGSKLTFSDTRYGSSYYDFGPCVLGVTPK